MESTGTRTHIFHCPCRLYMESTWSLHGVYTESTYIQSLHGVYMESTYTQSLHGVYTESTWSQHTRRVYMESTWSLCRLCSDCSVNSISIYIINLSAKTCFLGDLNTRPQGYKIHDMCYRYTKVLHNICTNIIYRCT